MLSIIIPVYNERKTIERLLGAVEKSKLDGLDKEIIIVDDYSTDGTREILTSFETKPKYRVFYHSQNRGKGAALRTGFQAARGKFIITQDADLEYDPQEYSMVIAPLIQNEADVVYGSRFKNKDNIAKTMPSHYLGNRFLTVTSNILTGLALTDMETGYKAFSRDALDKILPKLESNRFGIEPELTAHIAKGKLRIK